jgi:hypothetical protein
MMRNLNILGLFVNVLGTLLLLLYPPNVEPAAHNVPGAYVGLLTLVVGFALQLVAAIRTK